MGPLWVYQSWNCLNLCTLIHCRLNSNLYQSGNYIWRLARIQTRYVNPIELQHWRSTNWAVLLLAMQKPKIHPQPDQDQSHAESFSYQPCREKCHSRAWQISTMDLIKFANLFTKTSGSPSIGRSHDTPLHASSGCQKWTGGCAKSDLCLATDHCVKNCKKKVI
jgi:hypothetical protein